MFGMGDMNLICSAGLRDGTVCVYDMRSSKPVMNDKIHGGAINLVHLTNDGNIVTGSADSSVKVTKIGYQNP